MHDNAYSANRDLAGCERRIAELEAALRSVHDMLGHHADDDAREDDESPDDSDAWINGRCRQIARAALVWRGGCSTPTRGRS